MSSPKIEIKLPSISGTVLTPKVHTNHIDIKDRQLTPNLKPPRNAAPCFSNKKLSTKEFRSNCTAGRLSSYSSATERISIQTSNSKTKKQDAGGFTNIYLILCFVLVFGVLLGLLLGLGVLVYLLLPFGVQPNQQRLESEAGVNNTTTKKESEQDKSETSTVTETPDWKPAPVTERRWNEESKAQKKTSLSGTT